MQEKIQKLLKKVGARKEEGKDTYDLNGYRIKLQRNLVKWHRGDILEALDIPSSMFTKHGNFDVTYIKKSNLQQFDYILEILSKNKPKEVIRREKRQARKEARMRANWHEKRDWCKGCTFTEQKESDPKCAKMRTWQNEWSYFCSDPEWWNTWWCMNAERVYDENIFEGHFNCKLTKRRCPYSTPSIIFPKRELLKGHQECPKWVPGHGTPKEVRK